MSTATRTRHESRFAVREPLGPWAVWVRQQREEHGWTEADLAAVLWGESSDAHSSTQVRRWEAGHWPPNDDACQRLVTAFGTGPTGTQASPKAYGNGTDEWLPTRVAIADAITTARGDLDALGIDTSDAGRAPLDVVDLTDFDIPLADLSTVEVDEDTADADGWD